MNIPRASIHRPQAAAKRSLEWCELAKQSGYKVHAQYGASQINLFRCRINKIVFYEVPLAGKRALVLGTRYAKGTDYKFCRFVGKTKFAVAGCDTICDNIRQTMFYRRIARATVAAAAVVLTLALFGERQPLDRYQSVIDRQMFGPLPPNFDPTKSPSEISAKDARAQEQELTKEQEQVKSSIHFSVINVTPAGDTAVGFTDNSDSKSPKHYYLKVGESRDGWTVKEADPLKAEMTIAKGEIEVTLTIGGNSANGGTTKSTGAANATRGNATAGGRSNLLGGRLGSPAAAGGSRGLGSLRERRALREQQRAADAQAAAEEKAKAAEEKAQREAEREAEKAEREKEREEQRAQLLQIQEELRKAREAKEKEAAESKGDDQGEGESES